MQEIIKTTLLEYEKTAFIIDLVKQENGLQYVQILQTIHAEGEEQKRAIKFNPALLSDIVNVLNSYRVLFPDNLLEPKQNKSITSKTNLALGLTEEQKLSIQQRYFMGIPIPDLAIQFNCTADLIGQVLYNSGIPLMDNRLKPRYFFNRFKKRKK